MPKKPGAYVVYMLKCSDTSLYTGITNNLKRRVAQHKEGKGGHYTRSHTVVRLVYAEPLGNRSLALKREAAIKKLTRSQKLALINRNKFAKV